MHRGREGEREMQMHGGREREREGCECRGREGGMRVHGGRERERMRMHGGTPAETRAHGDTDALGTETRTADEPSVLFCGQRVSYRAQRTLVAA